VTAFTPTGFLAGRLLQPATLGILAPALDLPTRFVVGPTDWYRITWTASDAPGWCA